MMKSGFSLFSWRFRRGYVWINGTQKKKKEKEKKVQVSVVNLNSAFTALLLSCFSIYALYVLQIWT